MITSSLAHDLTFRFDASCPYWVFFPDYRGSVPYQTLLSAALGAGIQSIAGPITTALDLIKIAPTVFHLHWEDALYAEAGSEADTASKITTWLTGMAQFRAQGGTLIWTIHNAAPHEDRFPSLSLGLRQALARSADLIHVHCQTGVRIALELGAPSERILLLQIPDLSPGYPDDITDAAARRYFSIGSGETVFAYLGASRGYKNIAHLNESFVALRSLLPETHLIMAGRQAGYFEQRFLENEPGIKLIPRFIDDAVVQYVLRAADFVVLPYKKILTSGAASLALGFGRPVIVPNLPALLDVINPGKDALVYQADEPTDLLRVMIEATTMTRAMKQIMAYEALQTGKRTDFTMLANALVDAIKR